MARTGQPSVRLMWLGVVSCQVSGAWYFSEAVLRKWALSSLLQPGSSIKKMYPYLPTFSPTTQNIFLALLENKNFFCPIFIRKSWFFHNAIINFFFPTYLPNQKIQGRGTANNRFLRMAQTQSWYDSNIGESDVKPKQTTTTSIL